MHWMLRLIISYNYNHILFAQLILVKHNHLGRVNSPRYNTVIRHVSVSNGYINTNTRQESCDINLKGSS